MRNLFYMMAALLAFGTAYKFHQDVSDRTATVQKIRLVGDAGAVFKSGTVIDEAFMQTHFISQAVPANLEDDFRWAIYDNPTNRLHLTNRVLTRDVPAGSFLQPEHFLEKPREAFALRIEEGNRAFSIPVRAEEAVEVFIAPGARVDVIGAFRPSGGSGYSKRLLENVTVMAVGTFDSAGEFANAKKPEYRSVTLQAPADAVEKFVADAVDANEGLRLVLRNPCEGTDDCVGTPEKLAFMEKSE